MLETRKAQELDIVELTEDLPEYGLKKGERGVVVVVFDKPDEAYMLEFVDESGTSSRLAYAVKPNQIKTPDEIAKETFERGIEFINHGDHLKAEREFRSAISLKPDYIKVLHNSIVRSFVGSDEWQKAITAMHMVFRLNPEFELARRNLAIAYQKYGIQRANEQDYGGALQLFQLALSLNPPVEIVTDIKNSLAALFTWAGIQELKNGQILNALISMQEAHVVSTKEITRHNLGVAYVHLIQFYLDKEDFNDAVLAFERAEHTGIISAELLNAYGVALANLQRFDEAICAFERALEIEPEAKVIQENLNLAKNDATTNYSTEEIVVNFNPIPVMQPQEYSLSA